MSVGMYDLRVMLRVVEQIFTPETWFLNTFFNGETEQSQSEYIDIDIVKGGRVMAPICHPDGVGTPMSRYGFKTQSIKVPYVKPKVETTADQLLKRQPGESIYSQNVAPAVLAQRQVGKDLKMLKDSIVRREEWMAACALQTGVVQLVGKNVEQNIDFLFDASHIVVLVGTALWDDIANSQPLQNLRAWKRKITKDSGIVPNCVVLGSDVVDALYKHFEANTGLGKLLDNRRVNMGQIDPQSLPEGVVYMGDLEGMGIYSYDSYYQDSTGTLYSMMNPKKIVIGSKNARCTRHYGAVRHLSANAIVPYYPITWEQTEEGVRWLMLMSGILPAVHQPDAFMAITAVS